MPRQPKITIKKALNLIEDFKDEKRLHQAIISNSVYHSNYDEHIGAIKTLNKKIDKINNIIYNTKINLEGLNE